jgi:ubiquinone/menaquinone biosynthesis C-methylase UbiE
MGILTDLEKTKAIEELNDIAYAFWKSRALFTACELDIFSIIGDVGKTAENIALEANASKEGVKRLLNALVSLDLLTKNEDYYRNSDKSKALLLKSSPDYMGNILHLSNLWDVWTHLTGSVVKGGPEIYQEFWDKDDNWMRNTVESNHWKSLYEAKGLVDFIDLHDVKKVLDLGGSSGDYLIKLLERKPDLECTIFDHPRIIQFAKEFIEAAGYTDKIRILSGGFFDEEFGEENEYDLIIISHIISEYSIWDNVALIQKAYYFLKYGGKLIVHDHIIDDSRTSPVDCTLMSLDMLVNTRSGDVFTETDIWVMMREAMFTDIKKYKTTYGTSIMVGNKY